MIDKYKLNKDNAQNFTKINLASDIREKDVELPKF